MRAFQKRTHKMFVMILSTVMAGLVPAIHVSAAPEHVQDVDARDKRGHDDR